MKIQIESKMGDEEFEEPPSEMKEEGFAYNDPSLASTILASMDTLRQAGQLCDCVLRVGKKLAEFTAHQAVLASVSPYFMAMFEQDPRTEARKSYNVKETTPEAFQILLDYAYTGCLKLKADNIKEVYQAAILLKFQKVVVICTEYMINHLDISNCIEVRCFAGSDSTLVEFTNKYIQTNMVSLRETKAFLALPQINIKLLGYSRGVSGGPDSNTVAMLISNWLLTFNIQDGDVWAAASRSDQHILAMKTSTCWSSSAANNVAFDMQVLTEHDNVLFLDADNHLQDLPNMDKTISKTDAVQDYVKACKRYKKSKRASSEAPLSEGGNGSTRPVVGVVSHEQIHGSLYSVLVSINGNIHNVVVRMQTLQASNSTYSSVESGLNRTSADPSSSSGSSTEEDDKSNGLDAYYQRSLSTFKPLAEMAYARCGVGLVSWNSKLIAIGGNDRGECLNSAETYNSETNEWSSLPNMSSPRGRFECAVLNNRLFACGGSDGRRELDSVECFDGENWQPVPRMLSSKASAGVGVLNNMLYVIGGYNGQCAERSCEVFNPSTQAWSAIARLKEGRSQCAVCSNKGLLYAFGGTDSWKCSSSVEVYNPATNQWMTVAPMPQARRGAAATVFKGKIYIAGGSDGSKSLDTIEIYDCETNTWSSGPALQTPRSNAGIAVLAGRLYIAGGYGKNTFLSNMEVLEGDNDSQWCSYHKNGVLSASSDSDADH